MADDLPEGAGSVRGIGSEDGGEFAFLRRLRASLAGTAPPGEVHVGDDAAVLLPPSGKLLFATDIVVEGVHFDLRFGSVADAAAKAVSVNVSDIAAMGARATHLVAAVAAPPGTDLDQMLAGIEEAAGQYGVALVGGDLSGGDLLVISVAVIGDAGAETPVTRGGARPGDVLWCTGPLGASAAGLELLRTATAAHRPEIGDERRRQLAESYLRPVARVEEGVLAARLGATAMIDVSDGLASDVRHIAEESGVGIELDDVPVADGATEEEALGGGEDLELVFATGPPDGIGVESAFRDAGLRQPVPIGRCVDDPSVLKLRDGPLPRAGWVHRVGR